MGDISRRELLGLTATLSGSGLLILDTTGSSVDANRTSTVDVTSDTSAYLVIDELSSGKVYDEPHKVTLTNSGGVQISGSGRRYKPTKPPVSTQTRCFYGLRFELTPVKNQPLQLKSLSEHRPNSFATDLNGNNSISTTNGRLELRDSTQGPSVSIDPGSINEGESYTFEVVLASGQSGEVTDDIEISLKSSTGVSVDARRQTTVSQKSGARLVYGISDDVKVYNVIQDNENDPPDTGGVDVLGANAADITGDGDVDIPFVDGNIIYLTSVGATSETELVDTTNLSHDIKSNKTRLSVGKWPPATLSGKLILYVDNNSDRIFAADSSGNTEEIADPSNGAGGVAGVADIDGDGKDEIIFVDGSQQIRYLNQDGSVVGLGNGGIGSNNSAGFGPPANFPGYADIRIPFIDGSNQTAVIDGDNNKELLNAGGARKAAVAPVDIDGDQELEFMFIGSNNGKIKYVDNVGQPDEKEKGPLSIEGTEIIPDEALGLNSGVEV